MVKQVRLYIEGDTKKKGSGNFIPLRQGFNEFFSKWAEEENLKITFHSVLCGDRGKAVNFFLNDAPLYAKDLVILLIDTEREKDENKSAKDFLREDFPNSDFKNVEDWQCQFMAQAMESWFLADKEKLAACYDNKFDEKALGKHKEVEKIPKNDVIEKLKNATKDTSNGKGKYDKGESAGKILREIRPQKVLESAPHCKKLFESISKQVGE
jgi:hypothetical protein